MTFQEELKSWSFPTALETSPVPSIGSQAPSSEKLQLPRKDGKPVILTFLRHCGCPFAERTFLQLRKLAGKHPEFHYIAVSHSSQASTDKWLVSVGGSANGSSDIEIIVDEERELYALWGLGVSSAWHVLNPLSLWSVFKLGKEEGIWNRPTESGSRWQTGGSFAVDKEGVVRWVRVNGRADEVVRFEGAVDAAMDKGDGGK